MATLDDDADDAMALVNGRPTDEQCEKILDRLDTILSDCILFGPDPDDGRYRVDDAIRYLDGLADTPLLLPWVLVYMRWKIAKDDAARRDRAIETEFAKLLQREKQAADTPLTCPAPGAHARYHAESETSFWRRARGKHERPADGICRYCGKPIPKEQP